MTFTGAEIALLKKAATAVSHSLLTGPGAGAGTVDKPLRTSKIPGVERRKEHIDADDAMHFARELLKRAAKSGALGGVVADTELEALVAAVGMTIFSLPNARIDLQLALDAELDPTDLADRLRDGEPMATSILDDSLALLFDAVLDLTCAHVVEFFSRRDRFVAAALTHIILRDGHGPRPSEVHSTLHDYSKLVRNKFHQMRLFGLDLPDSDRAFDLMTGFVDLTIEEARSRDRHQPPEGRRISWAQVDSLVEDRRRVLLEGPAGSGKSTMLQRLTLNALSTRPNGEHGKGWLTDKRDLTRSSAPVLPFLIRLREFVSHGKLILPPPSRLLNTLTPELLDRLPGWEHSLLSRGHAILLVDGVDELPEQLRRPALDWLTGIVTIYPKARYVVTSRAAGIDDLLRSTLIAEGFTSAAINMMSPDQVATFVDRWHDAAKQEISTISTDPAASAASLKQAFRLRRDLARIATTPLLCAMICALYHSDSKTLPQNRTALYERAFAMLFEKRDSQQEIQTYPVRLSREQVEPFLSEFALWMLLERRRSIPKEIARTKVSAILPMLQIKNPPDGWRPTPDNMLRYLVERSGVLQDPTMDLLEFRHPSFQDYLAAKRVFQEEHLQLLIDNAHDPLYQDVAVMAAGQVQNDWERQGKLLGGLLERATKERRYSRQLRLLALACIADVGMVDRKWVKTIRARTKALLPPRTISEAQAIASAGDFVLDLLADVTAVHQFTSAEAEATIEAVIAIDVDDPTSTGILNTLAAGPAIDVRADLMKALHASNSPVLFARQTLGEVDFAGAAPSIDRSDLMSILGQLRNVEYLSLSNAGYADIEVLSRLPHLHHLRFARTSGLDLTVLGHLSHLVRLSVSNIAGSRLARLAELPQISELILSHTTGSAPSASALRHIRLLKLGQDVSWPSTFINAIPELRDLTLLDQRHAGIFTSENGPTFKRLECLGLFGTTRLASLEFSRMPHLTHLALDKFSMPELDALAPGNITHLKLAHSDSIEFAVLARLPGSIDLTIDSYNWDLLPIRQLAGTPQLTGIALSQQRGLELRPLLGLPKVSRLVLRLASDDLIHQLEELPQVTDLTLKSVVGVDLTKLAANRHLTSLTIHRVGGMDLSPLKSNPRLKLTVTDPTTSAPV